MPNPNQNSCMFCDNRALKEYQAAEKIKSAITLRGRRTAPAAEQVARINSLPSVEVGRDEQLADLQSRLHIARGALQKIAKFGQCFDAKGSVTLAINKITKEALSKIGVAG